MSPHLLAAAASLALVGAGFAGAEGTRSVDALPNARTLIGAGEGAGAGGANPSVRIMRGPVRIPTATETATSCVIKAPASDTRTDQQLLDWAKGQGQCTNATLGRQVAGNYNSVPLIGGGVGLFGVAIYAASSSNSA